MRIHALLLTAAALTLAGCGPAGKAPPIENGAAADCFTPPATEGKAPAEHEEVAAACPDEQFYNELDAEGNAS
jgi:hypothetical protein